MHAYAVHILLENCMNYFSMYIYFCKHLDIITSRISVLEGGANRMPEHKPVLLSMNVIDDKGAGTVVAARNSPFQYWPIAYLAHPV